VPHLVACAKRDREKGRVSKVVAWQP